MDALADADRIFEQVAALSPGLGRDEFDALARGVTADLRNHSNVIRRYLFLDRARLATLGDEGALGRHWTVDASDMSLDALLVPPEADSTWKVYEVEAWIDGVLPVDLVATIATRRDLPWEREIVLLPEAEVTVRSVRVFDEAERRPTFHTRQDLVGRRLHAAAPEGQAPAAGVPS